MQNTRLNRITEILSTQLAEQLRNPWRKFALVTICLLLGNFSGPAVSSIAGQTARLDTSATVLVVIFVELVNWRVYRSRRSPRPALSLGLLSLNAFKIGLLYSLVLQAFMLGS